MTGYIRLCLMHDIYHMHVVFGAFAHVRISKYNHNNRLIKIVIVSTTYIRGREFKIIIQ